MKSTARPILAAACLVALASPALAQQVSAPAILQYFETKWTTMSRRVPDLFMAGYGGVWIPPAGRADSGNQSVGYDVYDRFDLGNADNPTLYGTEGTLKRAVGELHRVGASVYADTVFNHSGFSDHSNNGFVNSGGYPGFALSRPGAQYGDYHAPESLGADNALTGRLAGLIDIDQARDFRLVRNPLPNPVDASGATLTNVPAGATPYFGKLANVPTEANRRFYQDRNRAPDRTVFNPTTGQADIPVWDFTPGTATTGDAVAENAVGYMMRHAQWMLQEVGVDGFRLDAAKHFPVSVLNDQFDLAVHRGNPRLNLDGSAKGVFSFSEAYEGNRAFLQTFIRKDVDTANPGRVGGNRDVLDMPLFFAVRNNFTDNGLANDWRNVVNAGQDAHDGGANNGSQGVAFVNSHDDGGVHLSNVAHAFMLMRPGNANVYFNAREFGNGRDFPRDGRGDALGGVYGDAVTTLVNLRNTHGRGDYAERWLDKETLVYERDRAALVALSNRNDNGFDARNVLTNFAPGTRLVEMTGNAADPAIDPTNVVPDFVVVDANRRVALNVPRNRNVNGVAHNSGYVVYGLPTPRGTLAIPDRALAVAGGVPTAATNAVTRLAALDVITADSFTIRLDTDPVLIGGYNDVSAGGDSALFSINGGVGPDGAPSDLNGTGLVDFRDPSNPLVYGFEEFRTKRSPLVGGGPNGTAGDGEYLQTIDATRLVEGYNYLEVRAFRARADGGPAVYSSFKKVLYVDRLAAQSDLDQIRNAGGNDRAVRIANPDGTADNVHAFLDLGAALTDAQVLALVGAGSNATQVDAGLWSRTFANVGTGNHNLTFVTYEPSGRSVIRRLTGQFVQTGRGAGLGDVNYDGAFNGADSIGSNSFETFLYARGQTFNAAADLNADGRVDNRDLLLLPARYSSVGAAAAAANARSAITRRGNVDGDAVTTAADIDFLRARVGDATGDLWLYDLTLDGAVTDADVTSLIVDYLFTRPGDANLDRRVDFADLVGLAQRYNQPLAGWANGDFDGSGTVAFADLVALAQNYNFAAASVAGDVGGLGVDFANDWALARALVPEPTSMLALAAASIATRRRRQS